MWKYDNMTQTYQVDYAGQALKQQQMQQALDRGNRSLKEMQDVENKRIAENNFRLGINLTTEERILKNKLLDEQEAQKPEPEVYTPVSQEAINQQYDNWYKQWLPYNEKKLSHLNDDDKRKEFQKYVNKLEEDQRQNDIKHRKKEREDDIKYSNRMNKYYNNVCYECYYTCCTIL